MSEADNEAAPHRRPHSKPAAEPYIEVDLAREIQALHREPEWKGGHNAKTLVLRNKSRRESLQPVFVMKSTEN
jgi:hypothetical protein